MTKLIIRSLLAVSILAAQAAAQAPVDSSRADTVPAPPEVVRPASYILLPLTSVFIPGFGQMVQRRYPAAAGYGLAGVSGLVVAANAGYAGDGSLDDILHDRKGARTFFYGYGLYQGAGFLSAWDAFHASVPALQQDKGRFTFLDPQKRETAADLFLAPFKPDHLLRPTTWVPLGVLGGLAVFATAAYRNDKGSEPGVRWAPYTASDAFFTGALSMNAGATEEAIFRGYMQPVFHQWSGQRSWISNPAQALLFGAAHLGNTPVPVVQGALGFYLGWLTERNDWRIGQAVAIHFWWDVIAVSTTLLTRHEVPVSLGSFSIPVDL